MRSLPTYLAAIFLCLTLASRLGNIHWSADYLALFHDWYLWGGLVLLLLSALLRRWTGVGLALTVVGINAVLISTYFVGGNMPDPTATSSFRLMSYNVYVGNPDLAAIVDEVRLHDPDVVFLMEYSFRIQDTIEAEFADYPYRLLESSRRTTGLALFSRLPLENVQIHRRQATRIPIFQADIMHNGQPISFVGGHPWPPLPQWAERHREQMGDITNIATNAAHPLIVTGDFNASQWSSTVTALRSATGVQDARLGRGLIKTWQLNFLRLTLDHILVSDSLQVLDYIVGDPGGSDHTPLVVDVQLTSQ